MGTLIRCCAVALIALTASAQLQENVTVELIEVPVYVTGPDGQPIRGLTKDNFELRVNRRAQPIEYFDAIDYAAPQPKATEAARPRRERRLYLLLFDQLYSIPGVVARAQRAAEAVVAQSDPQTDFFAVATYTANKGVQFVVPFLSDRVAVRRAIATLAVSKTGDPLRVGISPTERVEWIAPEGNALTDGGAHGTNAGSELDDMLHGGAAMREMQAQQLHNGAEDLLENFGDLAARLAAMEGQKHVLYFSLGFNSALVHGGDNPVGDFMKGGVSDAHTTAALDDMVRAFRSAGVFLDAIDIGGVRAGQGSLNVLDNDSLQSMAHGTGGDFVHNQNNLAAGLKDMTSAQQVVYVLAFNRRDRRGGSISVNVRGVPRGTTVSYRQGFGSGEEKKTIDPLQLADIMVNDIPESGLDVKLNASPSEIAIEIPREEVIQLGGNAAAVELLLYVYDANGSIIFARGKTLTPDQPMVVRAQVGLPSGHYVAKALVEIRGTNIVGFARREFDTP